MAQLSKLRIDVNHTPEVKAFNLKGKARLSGNITNLEFIEAVVCRCRPSFLRLYWKETPTQVFSSEYCEMFKNRFLYRIPLVAASEFLTKFNKNKCKENHFSVEIFSQISQKWFLSLNCNVFKDYSFTGFSQFLSFFKHVRGVSRTHWNIKTEPLRK